MPKKRAGGPACIPYARPLVSGTFVERPNRFLVRFERGDNLHHAHLADPGRLTELLTPGARLLMSPAEGRRKTAFTVELVRAQGRWIVINSMMPNRLVAAGLTDGSFDDLPAFDGFRREPRYEGGRCDFLLRTPERPFWLEVKGCSLVEDRVGLFPDAPTERGRRHLRHLIEVIRDGQGAGVLFMVGRDDADSLRPNSKTDPEFAALLGEAASNGVAVMAYRCRPDPQAVCLDRKIPVHIP